MRKLSLWIIMIGITIYFISHTGMWLYDQILLSNKNIILKRYSKKLVIQTQSSELNQEKILNKDFYDLIKVKLLYSQFIYLVNNGLYEFDEIYKFQRNSLIETLSDVEELIVIITYLKKDLEEDLSRFSTSIDKRLFMRKFYIFSILLMIKLEKLRDNIIDAIKTLDKRMIENEQILEVKR